MIAVMADEDDHVLERHYTIDHVYQSKTINQSQFTFEDVYILSTKEDIMEFFDYLFGKSREKNSRSMEKKSVTLNHVNHL